MNNQSKHKSFSHSLPRILVLVESFKGYGRSIVEGVIEYTEHCASWDIVHDMTHQVTGHLLRNQPKVDGIIAIARTKQMQDALIAKKVPVVLVISPPQCGDIPLIATDHKAVGKLAADYFFNLGFSNIGYCGAENSWPFTKREAAFKKAIDKMGRSCHTHYIHFPRGVSSSLKTRENKSLIKWLTALPKPAAIFTPNDTHGLAVLSACRQADLMVPEQIAVLGVNNDELACRLATPPLSSIDHSAHRIGYQASELLNQLLNGQPPPKQPIIIKPTGIITRQSTNTLAIDNREVAAAVRYIREKACDGIQVRDVLRHVIVSRRSLEMNFKRILNRTVHQEIMRTRLEHVRLLLAQTDWDMVKISVHCGFNYASRMSTIFKRATGLTPHAYRRKFHNTSLD